MATEAVSSVDGVRRIVAEPSAHRAQPGARSAAAQRAQSSDGAAAGAAERVAELEAARVAANRALAKKGSELTFEFDDALNRTIVRLVDKNTGEVVRQIPSEEALAITRALAEDQSQGLLVRTNA